MHDLLDAVTARIKAPYFGYALLAFAALNWRGIFLLLFIEGTPQARLAAFDAETTLGTLVFLPLLFGAVIAASAAWIKLVFVFISRRPLDTIDHWHLDSEHRKTLKKAQLERSRSAFLAEKEAELINRAKRDEEVLEIEDGQVKEQLINEIAALRSERDEMAATLNSNVHRSPLSPPEIEMMPAEIEMMKAIAKSGGGTLSKVKRLAGPHIEIGSAVFGKDDDYREYSKYELALERLIRKGLIKPIKPTGNDNSTFEVTDSGWDVADKL